MLGTRGDLQNCLMLIYLVTHVRHYELKLELLIQETKSTLDGEKDLAHFSTEAF